MTLGFLKSVVKHFSTVKISVMDNLLTVAFKRPDNFSALKSLRYYYSFFSMFFTILIAFYLHKLLVKNFQNNNYRALSLVIISILLLKINYTYLDQLIMNFMHQLKIVLR